MEKYGIKNKSQIETWLRWYRANEFIGSINQSVNNIHLDMVLNFASESEKKDRQNSHIKMENEILKKYLETLKELEKE